MEIVSYEFKRALPNPIFGFDRESYWVTFFCFFDGEKIHHFAHQSDMLENAAMARELGYSVQTFYHKVFVSDKHFPEIFNQIKDYVSRSHSD